MTIVLAIEAKGFTPESLSRVRYFSDTMFLIDEHGVIREIIRSDDREFKDRRRRLKELGVYRRIPATRYLLPGFVDTHVHAPQWAQTGTGLDEPLNVWLDKYTFPTEARFENIEYARTVYGNLVGKLLSVGTTTVVHYATIHRQASVELARISAEKGQRALVGRLVMDDPEANPDYYRDSSTRSGLDETERFIRDVEEIGRTSRQGVYPVISPRFIPSCTDEALKGLGRIAERHHDTAYIQTHCSEGEWEHHYAFGRYGRSDTEVLKDFGLLTDRSILGHCVHLSDKDIDLFHETGAIVSHCPHSNAFFASAVAPVRKYLDRGLKVGLGSDISGGFTPNLYETIRQSVISSRMLETGVNASIAADRRGVPDSALTLNQAFYLATAGGGEALGLPVGRLEPGYAWDAQTVDVRRRENPLPIFDRDEPPSDIFQKIMNLSESSNIRQVWVQGRLVVEK
ncbi:guanine deaminase [Bifidobacterium sp. SO4]|uniref:guanine deaminase n=1 Tax=Bifidobacterium sp. SO4 TaxID=2809030 RepID=UPI001BDC0573|nr:guanine deaminase [Bifidobacterium sp. SO4]MBT1170683.1 guanine deaminase [Bifidobacterium sp. SO4]